MSYQLYSTPQKIKQLNIIEQKFQQILQSEEGKLQLPDFSLKSQYKTQQTEVKEPQYSLMSKNFQQQLNNIQKLKSEEKLLKRQSFVLNKSQNTHTNQLIKNQKQSQTGFNSQMLQQNNILDQLNLDFSKINIINQNKQGTRPTSIKIFSKNNQIYDDPCEEVGNQEEILNLKKFHQMLNQMPRPNLPIQKYKQFKRKQNINHKKQQKQKKEQKKYQNQQIEKENIILQEQIEQIKNQIAEGYQINLQKEKMIDLHQNSNLKIPLFYSSQELIVQKQNINIYFDQQLGKGGFGVVYQADYQGQKCAVKISEVPWDQLNNLLSESIVQYFCKHKNLVKMYGIFLEDLGNNLVKVYFLMEIMKIDLRKLVFQERKKLSLKQKTNILIDILKGLEELHKNGYAHCDVKMPNILLDNYYNAKITDFGITKSLKQGQTNKTSLTGFSERISSYEYLVEQKISTKGDIWSFGILMYEFICESMAWNNLTGPQTVIKVSMKTPFFSHNSRVNIEFYDQIIDKCLNYDYKERPSATKLLEELIEYQDSNFV